MMQIINGASTTSRSPERMLTEEQALETDGCRINLRDGRWYTDWQLGLCGPIYGYAPEWWKEEIKDAVDCGGIGSIVDIYELLVARLLGKFYPDIEAIRFMVNGSDPCAAAVKLARAYTGRDKILVYGYHGTASAYAAPPDVNARPGMPAIDMRRGTLQAERDAFVPLEWLEVHPFGRIDNYAAVVIECPPMDGGREASWGWLQTLARWAHNADTLFILDEVVTGFRYGPGGAAQYYELQDKVDLYCFGKTLGNGYPVAALAGRLDVMQLLAEGVHFSGTFFGEPIGLAAAKATLTQLKTNPPWEHLYSIGKYLKEQWNALDIPWKLAGHPTRPIIDPDTITDVDEFTRFRYQVFKRGHIIVDHPWYVSTATQKADVDSLVKVARGWVG